MDKALNLYKGIVGFTHGALSSDRPTPWSVALQLVDSIPKALFNSDVLIPGSGYGSLALALVYRGWSSDKIVCIELSERYALAGQIILNQIGVKVIHADFFKHQFNMHFDVVLCNPPYNHASNKARNVKLWDKFIKLGLSLLKPNGHAGFVTPDSWAYFSTSQSNRQRQSIISQIDLKEVINVDSYFVGVSHSISVWWGLKSEYTGKTLVDGQKHDFSLGAIVSDERLALEAIYDKIKAYKRLPLTLSNGHVARADCRDQNGTPIRFSGNKVSYTSKPIDGAGISKFVAPFSCSFKSRFFTTDAVGMLNMSMPCSEEEAEEISRTWDLKIMRFFMATYRKTAGFTPAVKNSLIPDLRGLTDEQAYKALNLTEAEIKLVEDSL